MKEQTVTYYFRGTTVNWPGNTGSQTLPVTCTTRNPAKAVLFAMVCPGTGKPAIYIAKSTSFTHVATDLSNVFATVEEETGIAVAPEGFYILSEGYLSLSAAAGILRQMGVTLPVPVRADNLSQALEKVAGMTNADITKFVEMATSLLEKP